MKKTNIHEAVFSLSYDLGTFMSGAVHKINPGLSRVQVRALRLIWSMEKTTAIEIANTLKRDKAQITRILRELLEKKLVKRSPNPKDKRSHILMLTPKSKKFFRQVEDIEGALQDEMLQGIPEKDIATFVDVAHRIIANLKNMEGSAGK